jgi:hypothetical protein
MKTLKVIVVSILVTGFLLAAGSMLAFAQGNNIIFACVSKDGSLRIVALTGQCKDKESSLQWNIQGEQGPQGEPGPAGVLGFYTVQSEALIPGFSEGFRTIEETTARCNLGDKVTGGGHRYITHLADGSKVEVGFTDRLPPVANLPVAADPAQGLGEGWKVDVWSDSFNAILEVSVICADITP